MYIFANFMRLLHQQWQDSCLLSLNLCNLLQFAKNENFPICITAKKISPLFFCISGCVGVSGLYLELVTLMSLEQEIIASELILNFLLKLHVQYHD